MAGEFEIIDRLFAPLAAGHPGSFNLKNDAATLSFPPGEEAVLTLDTMSAGVHFLPDDPPDLVARKLLRVNLSDLAAMGARPLGYLLSIARPREIDDAWLEAFAAGLNHDQKVYGLTLLGGDSTSIKGPLSLSLTAVGSLPEGTALSRSGAKPGQHLFVTGSIGDAALGLKQLLGDLAGISEADAAFLAERYRLPQPRTSLGPELRGLASACIDVSDGLVADAQHLAEESGLAIAIDAGKVPLSAAAARALAKDPGLLPALLTGGDDYELLFAADDDKVSKIIELSNKHNLPIVNIGLCRDGDPSVVVTDKTGQPLPLERLGWTHF